MIAIGERELARLQTEFKAAANKLAPGKDPQATWLTVRRNHPKAGDVIAATKRIVDSLSAFVAAKGIASLPPNERVIVERAQPVRPRLRVDACIASAREKSPFAARSTSLIRAPICRPRSRKHGSSDSTTRR
jgi:hypothetical protein